MELLHFLVFLCLNSFLIVAKYVTYNSFVQCLTTKSIPKSKIQNIVYQPSIPSLTPILQAYIGNQRFNTSITTKPNIIIAHLQESHVQASVIRSKKLGLNPKIQSGGHDYEGHLLCIYYVSSVGPFTILDLSNIRAINVSIKDESAWVQAEVLVGEIYYRIWQQGKVHGFPSRICNQVGIGGHLSSGGYGKLLQKYGIQVDNIIDAQIVDVKDTLLDRKSMGENLFWEIRGGGDGARFGVVLSYKVKIIRVPPVVTVFLAEQRLGDNVIVIVFLYQSPANKIDPDLFFKLLLKNRGEQTGGNF